jgi:hypothetical protein
MFSLTIVFGPSGSAVALLFKDEERVKAVLQPPGMAMGLPTAWFETEDDFGQSVRIKTDAIHGMCVEDLSKNGDAQAERMVCQARAQAKAQNIANSDPGLRLMQTAGGMPAPLRGGVRM